jgi:hypothetical protein
MADKFASIPGGICEYIPIVIANVQIPTDFFHIRNA